MLFKKSLSVAAVLAIADVGHAVPSTSAPASFPLYSRDYPVDLCPSGYLVVQHQISQLTYPVVINQYFGENTIININGGGTINIINAPTSVSKTFTVTKTTTVTTTATQGGGTSPTAPATFLLQVIGSGLNKRQSGSALFLGSAGSVGGCATALPFSLSGGNLVGGGAVFGANSISTFAQLTAGGSTTKTFAISAGVLSWQNSAFTNGVATFCSLSGVVNAVFNGVIPSGCNPVSLVIASTSLCAASSSSKASSKASSTKAPGKTSSTLVSSATSSGSSPSSTSASSASASSSSTSVSSSSTSASSSSTSVSSSSATAASSSTSVSSSSTTSGTPVPTCNGIPNAVVSSSGTGCTCTSGYGAVSNVNTGALSACNQCGSGTVVTSGACACNAYSGYIGTLNGVTTCAMCGANTAPVAASGNTPASCACSVPATSYLNPGGTTCTVCSVANSAPNQEGTQCVCTVSGKGFVVTAGVTSCATCTYSVLPNGYCQ